MPNQAVRRGLILFGIVFFFLTFAPNSGVGGEQIPPEEPIRGFPAGEGVPDYNPDEAVHLAEQSARHGAAERGALIFSSPTYACISCHKVGPQGGSVGPELTKIGTCLQPNVIVESLLWPNHRVRESYVSMTIATTDGLVRKGYKVRESADELVLKDPQTGQEFRIARGDIEQRQETGTLMPAALFRSMPARHQYDLVKFLTELGHQEGLAELAAHAHVPASFPYVRDPLVPADWPHWRAMVNRDRVYDYYTKEAAWFAAQPQQPMLLPEFPGLDNGLYGHWGNQNEQVWVDGRWNDTDLGTLLCGVFHGAGVTVPKGVCVRIGEHQEMSACFNPQTLTYDALWRGGFLKFSDVRHGFLHGLLLDGTPLDRPKGIAPKAPFRYLGFYRDGPRVVFSYRIGDVVYLDSPWVENGKFVRTVAPIDEHPQKSILNGGQGQWPQVLSMTGKLGTGSPFAVDTVPVPFENPWNALMFFGGHDFAADGTAYLCTMQGDVWQVRGLDDELQHVRWKRFASGLHQALGVWVAGDDVFVLGRNQITRLRDLNGDDEADAYECFSDIYETSTAGHDFICGLQRDEQGRFYTVSGNQGLLRISADGRELEILATGFRNPDGLGLTADGNITIPCSEGEWTPASMICEVPVGASGSIVSPTFSATAAVPPFYGYGGPQNGQPPELPMVYLPRGLDNSSGEQVAINSSRWGPLEGNMIHMSFGSGSHFLLLKQQLPAVRPSESGSGSAHSVHPTVQGAVVPLPGEFLSGAHRGRFAPHDGQLYVTGMAGWGSYTPQDGCFQRVRYTGGAVRLPIRFEARRNGMLVTFSEPVDAVVVREPGRNFAQAWNYRYSSAYGSAEFSPSHPGVRGHDHWRIDGVHVLGDGRRVFYEIPEIQPVSVLHLQTHVGNERPVDLFATLHSLGNDFTDFPGYEPVEKTIAAHPLLIDLATATKMVPNPYKQGIAGAREVVIEAGKNLSYSTRLLTAKAGEPIKLTFWNPDVVPHNWVLVQPGALARVGDLANRLIADPEAVARHYVPQTDDVLYYTDIVPPTNKFAIYFKAPSQPGRYPYLCTFPGHWMVMNGELVVE